jgi:phage gpG-like protein
MSVPFTIGLSDEATTALKRFKVPPVRALMRAVNTQNELTAGWAKAKYLSTPGNCRNNPSTDTLHVVSDGLRSRLRKSDVTLESDSTMLSAIGCSGIKYAAIHEYGGTIPKRGRSRNGKSTITIPRRSYIRRALDDRRTQYVAALSQTISDALKGTAK